MPAHASSRISAAAVKNAYTGKHSDGGGLWLEMGLGSYPDLALKDARDAAAKWRTLAAQEVNPIKQRQKERREAIRNLHVLNEIAADAFESRKAELKGDGEAGRWWTPLKLHVLPKLGKVPVAEIDQTDIRDALPDLAQQGRDHHPGPRALPFVARATLRLAVNGDDIAVAEECRDLGQHPPEGGIQHLRINHPEHRGIGVMRRDRMPELQKTPENILFCSPEGCHLGAVGCTAEHGDKAHDQQFAKVVTPIVSPGIGDVVEGGKKDVDAGNPLQKGVSCPRIYPPQNRKTPQIRSDPKRDSPTRRGGAWLGLIRMPPDQFAHPPSATTRPSTS